MSGHTPGTTRVWRDGPVCPVAYTEWSSGGCGTSVFPEIHPVPHLRRRTQGQTETQRGLVGDWGVGAVTNGTFPQEHFLRLFHLPTSLLIYHLLKYSRVRVRHLVVAPPLTPTDVNPTLGGLRCPPPSSRHVFQP